MDIIRKSAAALVLKIIIAEIIVEVVYLILSLGLASFSNELGQSYEAYRAILSLIFIAIAIGVLALLVAQWSNEGYVLEEDDIAVRTGIVTSTVKTYPYANMQAVTVNQGPVGKLFNYGNVSIFVPTLGKNIIFQEVSSPHKFADKIKSHIPYPEKNQFVISKKN